LSEAERRSEPAKEGADQEPESARRRGEGLSEGRMPKGRRKKVIVRKKSSLKNAEKVKSEDTAVEAELARGIFSS